MGNINYGIFRLKPLKNFSTLTNITKHNNRSDYNMKSLQSIPDKFKSGTHHGLIRNSGSGDYQKDFEKAKQNWAKKNNMPVRIQSNSILGYDVVFTTSNYMKGDYLQWSKDNIDFLKNVFGEDNVHSAFIHDDEAFEGKKTPMHMHVFVTPFYVSEKMNKVVLGAKHFTGSDGCGSGRSKLSKLQDKYFNDVASKYGLERGLKGSKAKHIDPTVFKSKKEALNNKQKAFMSKREQAIREYISKLTPEQRDAQLIKAHLRLQDQSLESSKRDYFMKKFELLAESIDDVKLVLSQLQATHEYEMSKGTLKEEFTEGRFGQKISVMPPEVKNGKSLLLTGILYGLFACDSQEPIPNQKNGEQAFIDYLISLCGMSLEDAKNYLKKAKEKVAE